jgi:hypothetical protein
MTDAYDAEQLADLDGRIDEWLAELAEEHDHIVAVDRSDDGPVRWYVRMRGDDKEFTTVWLTLGQRTLRYETYVMPAPEENDAELYEHLLRRNDTLVGAHFSIGIEDAVFLRGEMPVSHVTRRTRSSARHACTRRSSSASRRCCASDSAAVSPEPRARVPFARRHRPLSYVRVGVLGGVGPTLAHPDSGPVMSEATGYGLFRSSQEGASSVR